MWQDASYELRESQPRNIKAMHEKEFSCLKLSVDQIQSEESKLCYLYYCDVQLEDLLRFGIGKGLFSDQETIDEAKNRVHSIISNLKMSLIDYKFTMFSGQRDIPSSYCCFCRWGTIPTQVISSPCHLQELYLGGSYSSWEVTETEESATLAEEREHSGILLTAQAFVSTYLNNSQHPSILQIGWRDFFKALELSLVSSLIERCAGLHDFQNSSCSHKKTSLQHVKLESRIQIRNVLPLALAEG
ncbi:hypothetical protein Cgig2_001607 [Carnegiea gigantea]|uniref:Uncharacterized protein n=1 Tax=Carnegiea gigantea TaxID=171969 RepID=A0A9Q1KBM9_9CARY|nr:hypothetical protein Cgig2_001607 [Carnegiea gigantea]